MVGNRHRQSRVDHPGGSEQEWSREAVHSPAALEPGLSLGSFDDRAQAGRALERFTQQGIRNARVVEITAPASSYRLRADAVDAAQAAQLGGLKADALEGKPFSACAPKGAG